MLLKNRHWGRTSMRKKRSLESEAGVDEEEERNGEIGIPSMSSFTPANASGVCHSYPGSCTISNNFKQRFKSRRMSAESGVVNSMQSHLLCPKKLFTPPMAQVRYISERIVEVFTAKSKGKIELHHILHPNMPRHTRSEVESIELTDGLPGHRVTARDVVDRAPYSVHGTFSGRIDMVKATCSTGLGALTSVEVCHGENPVMAIKVNQLDNAFLAATEFQCVSGMNSLFVLDLVRPSKTFLESRYVFRAATRSDMLDVCWLWDHPARLVLSTTDSIRLFDIRSPKRTDQALFLDRGVTHMASNRYRTHVFAGFNGDQIHIYDSRQLFGPLQQIKISMDYHDFIAERSLPLLIRPTSVSRCHLFLSVGYGGLNCLRWNPYMPYELLVHFRDSSKILRCNAKELPFDPFRRRVFDSFKSDDVFSVEQVWDGNFPADLLEIRRKRYATVYNCYSLLGYGEMYDKCKEDLDSPLPLCWSTPTPNTPCAREGNFDNLVGAVIAEQRALLEPTRSSVSHEVVVSKPQPLLLRRHSSDSELDRVLTRIDARVKHPEMARVLTPPGRIDSPIALLIASRFLSSVTPPMPSQTNQTSHITTRSRFAARLFRSQSDMLEEVSISDWSSSASNANINNVCKAQENEVNGRVAEACEGHLESFSRVSEGNVIHSKNDEAMHLTKSVDDFLVQADPRVIRTHPSDHRDSLTGKGIDNGLRIKLKHNVCSFDFAPVGYSGILCLTEQTKGLMKLVFVPFIAPDEGYAVKPEFLKVLEEVRMWESFDSIPYYLYHTMKSRLHNGMDRIENQKIYLSIFERLAESLRMRWVQWAVNTAKKQLCCNELKESSDLDDTTTEGDEPSNHESTPISEEDCSIEPALRVKGLPGILQLCSLEEDSHVVWKSCDSIHFTNIKIARSPIRRRILEPFCLPVSASAMVSDEKFATSTDILEQIPIIYLCLINGDTIRFIEYTLFLRRKLGKPAYDSDPCSFLNAFHFFSSVVSRYVKKICGATNKSSPIYIANRLHVVDKIELFVKTHKESRSLNPLFIPMLLFLLGEMTFTHPETFTSVVLKSKTMALPYKIAWCVNLLSSTKMKEALHTLFEQSNGLDRLQFVGLGRHPDSLQVLSDYLYTTQDCQVFSHLLVAGRCLEDGGLMGDERESDDNSNSDDEESVRSQGSNNVPTLSEVFPTSYLQAEANMLDLLHLARAELCRYTFILQRMERYCLRRRLLSLVPQICWPDSKAVVDFSCTFCGSSREVALRNAESIVSEQVIQVRSRPSVTRSTVNRSSSSVSSTPMALSFISTGFSDSDTSTVTSSAVTPSTESSYDYNGIDGGTEAEIKRPPDSACPQCRKSYPRCCLCGLSYGTPVNDYDHPAETFSMMFCTCLMCSHGGHAKHVIAWFEKEDECPILGCECRCLFLESGISGRIKQKIMTSL